MQSRNLIFLLMVIVAASLLLTIFTQTSQQKEINEFKPPSSQEETTTQNSTRVERDIEQCSCPACGCNAQSTCPKYVPTTFVVLSSMEDCGAQRKVPGIGLVNILSDTTNGRFQYYLVDETNKNRAMNGYVFSYSPVKSIVNSNTVGCVSDNTPATRFPTQIPGKAYLIAKSTSGIQVRFNIQMSCVIAPFSKISLTVESSSSDEKLYVGTRASWFISFVNQYNEIDTWQQGRLMLDKDNTIYTSVIDGKATFVYASTAAGQVSLSLIYTPTSQTAYQMILNTPTVTVYNRAQLGSMDFPERVPINGKSEFSISYKITDTDHSILTIDIDKLSFTSQTIDVSCSRPTSSYGSGSVTCRASDYDHSSPPTNILIMKYDGNEIASKSFTVYERPWWFDIPLLFGGFILLIVLASIVVIVAICSVVVGCVIGIVTCVKRRRETRIKLRDEELIEEAVLPKGYTQIN